MKFVLSLLLLLSVTAHAAGLSSPDQVAEKIMDLRVLKDPGMSSVTYSGHIIMSGSSEHNGQSCTVRFTAGLDLKGHPIGRIDIKSKSGLSHVVSHYDSVATRVTSRFGDESIVLSDADIPKVEEKDYSFTTYLEEWTAGPIPVTGFASVKVDRDRITEVMVIKKNPTTKKVISDFICNLDVVDTF